jgi:cell division protease FtsH
MTTSLSSSLLAQHIQQQFRAKNVKASQPASASPAPAENTTVAKPIQVEIVPPKTTAKANWISLLTLGACFGLITANLWVPSAIDKFNELFNKNKFMLSGFIKLIEKTGVTFNDVIGAEESKKDLMDILDFIKNPEKYRALGAKVPSGVLLQGPPGTGKTLLAKAVAGEAGIPFLSASGSDFVEMFVGVGAKRVRDLFRQAREKSKNTPVIIFIDEIDSLIQNRAKLVSNGGDSEHSATLNALLTEMDGMVQSEHPIIVMGATNAPVESLDPAMLRPGRLSRHVQVALPDLKGRQGLFDYYGKKYKLSSEAMAHLNTLAKNSFGFSGADIENILNEAAMLTARNNLPSITPDMLEEAVERVIQGHTKDLKLTDEVKKQIAVHEIGHAIVGHFLESKNEVRKITLTPRGNSLGATWIQPKEGNDNSQFQTKEEYVNKIATFLGGRIAEEIVNGPQKVGTGASGDLEVIEGIARTMVERFGWNGITPRSFKDPKQLSPETRRRLERAIEGIIKEAQDRAKYLLESQKRLLNEATKAFLKKETLSGDEFEALVKKYKTSNPIRFKYRIASAFNSDYQRI